MQARQHSIYQIHNFWPFLALLGSVCLAGCGPGAGVSAPPAVTETQSAETIHNPVAPASLAGQYLAGLHAQQINDIAASARFFQKSLSLDRPNDELLRLSFLNHYQNGDLAMAAGLSAEIEKRNLQFGLAAEPALALAVKKRDWQALIALAEKIDVSESGHILATLLRAYAYIGQSEPETALLEIGQLGGLSAFSHDEGAWLLHLQRGYMAELQGQLSDAVRHYRDVGDSRMAGDYAIITAAAGLVRSGAPALGEQMLAARLSRDYNPAGLIAGLKGKTTALYQQMSAEQAIARLLLELSWFSQYREQESLLIARAHLALSLWPDFDDAHMILAEWYIQTQDYQRAKSHLAALSDNSAYALKRRLAELEIAEAQQETDVVLPALSVYLEGLQTQMPDSAAAAQLQLLAHYGGDILRRDNSCSTALDIYQLALAAGSDDYRLYRSMAICFEQTGQDEKAEIFFDEALGRNPDDAVTLNYQGYWWADEGRQLDRAIAYIKRAVELQPGSGYYADSLGWVYYRLQRYDEAVFWLEKAIQLTPTDPVISDHLGDAYWQTGRRLEARYKWQHALDLGIAEAAVPVILHKIKQGL